MSEALYSQISPVSQHLRDLYKDKSTNLIGNIIEYPVDGFDWEDLRRYSVVILGIGNSGEAEMLSKMRQHFYALYLHVDFFKILDLGDYLSSSNEQHDQVLEEVLYKCLKYNTFTIVVGQSLTYVNNCYAALKGVDSAISISQVSNNANLGDSTEPLSAENYMAHLLEDRNDKLFGLNVIGYQLYQTDPACIAKLSEYYCQTLRLGAMRNDIKTVEPILRDSDLFSVNMASVRLSDAPSVYKGSPNGLYAEELCQLARYAGISDRLKLAGIFGFTEGNDLTDQTIQLVVQVMWHLLDGYVARKNDNPLKNVKGIKKYIVDMGAPMHQLVFYFSNLSERWWMEVPSNNSIKSLLVACSHDDYRTACNLEVPLRWIWFHQKITQNFKTY